MEEVYLCVLSVLGGKKLNSAFEKGIYRGDILFSLMVVYTIIVFLVTSVLFFANAIRKEAQTVLQGTPEMIIQKMMAGRHDLIPLNYADKII